MTYLYLTAHKYVAATQRSSERSNVPLITNYSLAVRCVGLPYWKDSHTISRSHESDLSVTMLVANVTVFVICRPNKDSHAHNTN